MYLYLESTGGHKQDASEQQTSLKSPGNEHHQEVTYQCVCTHLEPRGGHEQDASEQQTSPKSPDSMYCRFQTQLLIKALTFYNTIRVYIKCK